MNIQSLSVCVPATRCYNDCKFCCSKMHGGDYENLFANNGKCHEYLKAMKDALEFARDNGCNTCMLTGNNEPQQDVNFLKVFSLVNQNLNKPFRNIEMQTSGALVDEGMLSFLKNTVGVNTMAVSTACINDAATNLDMVQSCDKNLNLDWLYTKIKEYGFNLRICLNMNDNIYANVDGKERTVREQVEEILALCKKYKADQITFRKLWAPKQPMTDQKKWIDENVGAKTDEMISIIKELIKSEGTYLDTLEYGAKRYDFRGFSVVIDEDSMSQETDKQAVKYLIFRPNGHLYSKWDTPASLIL